MRTWVDTYNHYKEKCNQPNNVKKMLKRLEKSWDSWPSKVWQMTTEDVQLVKEHMALSRAERCAGILKGFWNTFRGKTSGSSVKQEQPDDVDEVEYSEYFTGDLPPNSLVGLKLCQQARPYAVC